MFEVDKHAVSLHVLPLPVRKVGDVQGILVVEPYAWLALNLKGLLAHVLVSHCELLLCAC